MLKNLCFGILAGVTVAGVATSAAAISPEAAAKIAPSLHAAMQKESASRFDVLVYLKDQADLSGAEILESREAKGRFVYKTLTETAKRSQAGVLSTLATESAAGVTYRRFYISNMVAVKNAPRALIESLASRGDVGQLVHDKSFRVFAAPTKAQLTPEDPTSAIGDNIRRTGADRIWSELGTKGEGMVVAGADTGIEWDHPGLKAHYRGWNGTSAEHDYNWHDAIQESLTDGETVNPCGYATREPCDDNAHGTHTVGTMIGDDGQGNQIGMAPDAKFIGCRNMDEGVGRPSTYLDCFEWFLAPYPHGANPLTDGDPAKAPNVINNSWGCPTDEGCNGNDFLQAIKALGDAGVMVVAAAGNAGSSCSTISDAPAHHTDEVFVVGAVDHRNGNIASFSSRGPSLFDNKVGPDLTAPGVSVRSAIPGGGFSGSMWSGTSMAAPHVAGAVALLWSHDKSLVGKIGETIARFTSTAEGKTTTQSCGGVSGSTIPNNTYGYGIMNVYAAATAKR